MVTMQLTEKEAEEINHERTLNAQVDFFYKKLNGKYIIERTSPIDFEVYKFQLFSKDAFAEAIEKHIEFVVSDRKKKGRKAYFCFFDIDQTTGKNKFTKMHGGFQEGEFGEPRTPFNDDQRAEGEFFDMFNISKIYNPYLPEDYYNFLGKQFDLPLATKEIPFRNFKIITKKEAEIFFDFGKQLVLAPNHEVTEPTFVQKVLNEIRNLHINH